MYDFDIFSVDLSLVGLSRGAALLAKMFFSNRKINLKINNV